VSSLAKPLTQHNGTVLLRRSKRRSWPVLLKWDGNTASVATAFKVPGAGSVQGFKSFPRIRMRQGHLARAPSTHSSLSFPSRSASSGRSPTIAE
jgi:hypothetical protein